MNGPYIQAFGNLTRDPQKRYSQNNGTEYARITVAVNTYSGPDRRETEYFSVNLYGNQMQTAMGRCETGTPVYVAGRFSHSQYERPDGSPAYDLHIEARDFRVLHRAPRTAWQEEEGYATDSPQAIAENPSPITENELDFHANAPLPPAQTEPDPETLAEEDPDLETEPSHAS